MSLIDDLFAAKGKNLYWQRMDDEHVDPPLDEAARFTVEQSYVVIRLTGMYLARTRLLWRKYYPMLHAFATSGSDEEQAVVDPSRLRQFGEANLDRMVIINERLAGPFPYRGQDFSVLVGLYSVPGEDAAKALLTTIGSLAALGGVALGQAQQIAQVVKQGIESVLSLGETQLQLGVRDTFYSRNPLKPGYHVGIAADRASIDSSRLWLVKNALTLGDDPNASRSFTANDYMVVEVESLPKRDDWPGLPGLKDFDAAFGDIMRDGTTSPDDKRKRINDRWPAFQQTLRDSPYLVEADRQRIALAVAADLQARVLAFESGLPFETRGWTGQDVVSTAPNAFAFTDVADVLDTSNPDSRASAETALEAMPF